MTNVKFFVGSFGLFQLAVFALDYCISSFICYGAVFLQFPVVG